MAHRSRNLADVPELAEYLGTSVRHVRSLIARRAIPHIKVGHLVRFDLDVVDDWLDCHRVPIGGAA